MSLRRGDSTGTVVTRAPINIDEINGQQVEETSVPETDPPIPTCRRCGAIVPDDGRKGGHCRFCGGFLRGNGDAVKTALAIGRARLPEVMQLLEDRAGAFVAASLADDGEDIPTRRHSLHEYRGVLHLQILRLNAALETHGIFDKKDKLRDAWLRRLESLINTAKGIDHQLGLDRRARRVRTFDNYAFDVAADASAEGAADGGGPTTEPSNDSQPTAADPAPSSPATDATRTTQEQPS